MRMQSHKKRPNIVPLAASTEQYQPHFHPQEPRAHQSHTLQLSRRPLYGQDDEHRPYWSVTLPHHPRTYRLLYGFGRGEYVKVVEDWFGLRIRSTVKGNNCMTIWPEEFEKTGNSSEEIRPWVDKCYRFLQSWADEVIQRRESKKAGDMSAQAPTIKEWLEVWVFMVECGQEPSVAEPIRGPLKV
ncbi:uncharacterized protein LY89DRAFT_734711 [Mollisia scopiformis]|uniref:Uncharacterized protein n=1 Tax=Mollisia scopiformis TaxID=149040 RepID=A0A194X8X1_MOLSC|nr:uncharacterized protein LY89DRAFT_734711 [Mollisia scopiformis]KUJ16616.1 hypothetical protein LY89DRAFT_734711 [Mollisia scopiformis]